MPTVAWDDTGPVAEHAVAKYARRMNAQVPRLYPVRQGGKEGFINASGVLVVPAEHDLTSQCCEGRALVGERDKAGKKDPVSRMVKKRVGFVDMDGRLAIPLQFDDARDFSEGLAAARLGKKWGYIDTEGRWVIEPVYDNAWSFSEERAAVDQGKATLCLRPDGSTAFVAPSRKLGAFKQGLASCEIKRVWNYLTPNGDVAFTVTATAASEFSDGRALVLSKGHHGFIDLLGTLVIPFEFGAARAFSEGLASATPTNGDARQTIASSALSGYIDTSGAMVIEPRWQLGDPFSEGLAAVLDPAGLKTRAYVDRTGKVVLGPLRCELAGPMRGGLAMLMDSQKIGYIDRTGASVWPMQS